MLLLLLLLPLLPIRHPAVFLETRDSDQLVPRGWYGRTAGGCRGRLSVSGHVARHILRAWPHAVGWTRGEAF